MSLTNAVHKRFWSAMGERFGKRWLDEYDDKPTRAWRDMLDRYTPNDISGALTLMDGKGWQYPPTLPQFEPLLKEAARHNKPDDQDWVRGYWRSVIVDRFSRDFWLGHLIPSMEDFEQYLIQHRDTLGVELRQLLDHVDGLEKRTGQRTEGMHELIYRASFKITHDLSPAYQYWLKCRKEGMKLHEIVGSLKMQVTVRA